MGSCDMRVKALSGLDALERSQTQDDVIGAIRDALEFAGAEFFCFNFLPQPKEKFENVILATNVPAPWLQLYIEQDFAAADPSIRFCRHTVHPFEYKDAPYNAETEPRAAEVMRRAEGFICRAVSSFRYPVRPAVKAMCGSGATIFMSPCPTGRLRTSSPFMLSNACASSAVIAS
jgi:hypothetical protein